MNIFFLIHPPGQKEPAQTDRRDKENDRPNQIQDICPLISKVEIKTHHSQDQRNKRQQAIQHKDHLRSSKKSVFVEVCRLNNDPKLRIKTSYDSDCKLCKIVALVQLNSKPKQIQRQATFWYVAVLRTLKNEHTRNSLEILFYRRQAPF